MERNLFTILKSGLDTAAITDDDIVALKACTQEEWQQMADLAVKQSVGVVFFDGIQQIYAIHGEILPKTEWARELKGRLFGITLQLEQRNRKQIAVMNKVGGYMHKHGCRMMVMKGQACAAMYPNPLHRSIGDIDCYLYDDYAKGNELIRHIGVHVDDSWYKHSEFCIEGENFENHQYFVTTRGGEHYKRLDKKLKEIAKAYSHISSLNVQYPPVMFNALFLTYHAFIHFVSEGLRLKQVLDWVMFVKQHQDDVDWLELHRCCVEYKLNRFLEVMNAIAVDVFAVERRSKDMGCVSPYTEKVIHSILYDDDYIFNTTEGKWRQRFLIVSNMIKYRWKYRDICEQSVMKQLWMNVMGLIFKTE